MSNEISARTTILFVLLLIGLFLIAVILLWGRSSPAPNTGGGGAATGGAATGGAATATSRPQQPVATPTIVLSASCKQQIDPYLDQLDPLVSAWENERAIADAVDLDSLPAEVQQLRSLRAKAQDLVPPTCAAQVQELLLEAMDQAISAYRGFIDQLPDADVRESFRRSKASFDAYQEAVKRLRAL